MSQPSAPLRLATLYPNKRTLAATAAATAAVAPTHAFASVAAPVLTEPTVVVCHAVMALSTSPEKVYVFTDYGATNPIGTMVHSLARGVGVTTASYMMIVRVVQIEGSDYFVAWDVATALRPTYATSTVLMPDLMADYSGDPVRVAYVPQRSQCLTLAQMAHMAVHANQRWNSNVNARAEVAVGIGFITGIVRQMTREPDGTSRAMATLAIDRAISTTGHASLRFTCSQTRAVLHELRIKEADAAAVDAAAPLDMPTLEPAGAAAPAVVRAAPRHEIVDEASLLPISYAARVTEQAGASTFSSALSAGQPAFMVRQVIDVTSPDAQPHLISQMVASTPGKSKQSVHRLVAMLASAAHTHADAVAPSAEVDEKKTVSAPESIPVPVPAPALPLPLVDIPAPQHVSFLDLALMEPLPNVFPVASLPPETQPYRPLGPPFRGTDWRADSAAAAPLTRLAPFPNLGPLPRPASSGPVPMRDAPTAATRAPSGASPAARLPLPASLQAFYNSLPNDTAATGFFSAMFEQRPFVGVVTSAFVQIVREVARAELNTHGAKLLAETKRLLAQHTAVVKSQNEQCIETCRRMIEGAVQRRAPRASAAVVASPEAVIASPSASPEAVAVSPPASPDAPSETHAVAVDVAPAADSDAHVAPMELDAALAGGEKKRQKRVRDGDVVKIESGTYITKCTRSRHVY